MLERYFVKPETVDRIRSSWIGASIEQYVGWMSEQGYAARNVFRRVPILVRFGAFAQARGARRLEELPDHIDAFVTEQLRMQGAKAEVLASRNNASSVRSPIEQMLRVALPALPAANHRPHWRLPFIEQAPGFFAYLREERGLREPTVDHYGHFLRRFETYLGRIDCHSLGALSAPVLSAFVTECSGSFGRSAMIGLCSSLRVFLRYLRRESVIVAALARHIELPQVYRLAELPRSIGWDDVRRMLETVDVAALVSRRQRSVCTPAPPVHLPRARQSGVDRGRSHDHGRASRSCGGSLQPLCRAAVDRSGAMTTIGPIVYAFFEQHLKAEKGLSPSSVSSYRDALRLFLIFIASERGRAITRIAVADLTAERVRHVLNHLEVTRGNHIRSRNQRLAALHTFFNYLARQAPEALAEAERVAAIPKKRSPPPPTQFLERDEIETLMASLPSTGHTALRDRALLLFLYNTGARVQEAADLRIANLQLEPQPRVNLHGKGDKWRTCPLCRRPRISCAS